MPRRRSQADWPNVEPVRSTRIYEEIVRQIRALIADGQLKSGDRLPPERDLAERFRVSRTSVREAMRALESTGLVEIRPGEGAFVRQVSVEALVEPLAVVILGHRAAIAELFEARRLIEPPIAGLAARRATPDEVAELRRILDAQSGEVAAGRTGLSQDAQFHAAIAHSTHNHAITRIVTALVDLLTQSREESLSTPGRPQRSDEDHRRILAAIEGRDAAAAEQAMLGHLVAVERLVTGPPEDAKPAGRPPSRRRPGARGARDQSLTGEPTPPILAP
jgi:GntR family transcriptional repressor for pyruvate dehydrogenase complex